MFVPRRGSARVAHAEAPHPALPIARRRRLPLARHGPCLGPLKRQPHMAAATAQRQCRGTGCHVDRQLNRSAAILIAVTLGLSRRQSLIWLLTVLAFIARQAVVREEFGQTALIALRPHPDVLVPLEHHDVLLRHRCRRSRSLFSAKPALLRYRCYRWD